MTGLAMELLRSGGWGRFQPMLEAFLSSEYGAALQSATDALQWDALYISHVHGYGHIERTMIHGAMCAWAERLSGADTALLLTMCAYHDTGRDGDFLDASHGAKSAVKLAALTGLSGEALQEAMAGIEAHSVNDRLMDEILDRYAPENRARARMLAEMLKDADGLDRVRIHDLNVKFLRREPSAARGDFAQELFDRYVAAEKAAGAREAEGFDLETIRKVKAFVSDCFARGESCAQTCMRGLGMLTGTEIADALLEALRGETERCGMLHAALLFFGFYGGLKGLSDAEVTALRRRYRAAFAAQYGSELCAAVKPEVGCGGFAVDGILFAIQFLDGEKENENKNRDLELVKS